MQYLDEGSRTRLESLRSADPFVDQALQQLDRVLASRTFARVHQQARDFLAFVVAQALLGQQEQIKEPTIAIFVYGEPADFNPAESARVRVAGSDLRRRLRKFYETEGMRDRIHVALPAKGFVPEIRDRYTTVAILLENWKRGERHGHLPAGIRDEIIERLNDFGWIRAAAASTPPSQGSAQFLVRGSLEMCVTRLRLHVVAATMDSDDALWSEDFEDERDHAFALARRIAEAIAGKFEESSTS
jgi:TolB-like protein